MRFCRTAGALLFGAVIVASLQPPVVQAAMLPTPGTFAAPTGDAVSPAALASRLRALGVPPAQARARVDGLSMGERGQLHAQLDSAPAGGDLVGALTFAALILLITDILGYTDVFPFVTNTVNGAKPVAAAPAQCVPDATAAATR